MLQGWILIHPLSIPPSIESRRLGAYAVRLYDGLSVNYLFKHAEILIVILFVSSCLCARHKHQNITATERRKFIPAHAGLPAFSLFASSMDSEVKPARLPSCMVSTTELGTITIVEFCFNPSYSMFIALKCSATGLLV